MVLFERLLQHTPAIETELAFHMQVLYRTAGWWNAPYVVQYVYRPRVEELSKSVAYLQMFLGYLPETERAGRGAMACGACSSSDESDRTEAEESGPMARPVLH